MKEIFNSLEASDWIAITNMLATLLLSYFVYKATKKSADATEQTAILTEESIKLSRAIQQRQDLDAEKHKHALRIQYVDVLNKKCKKVLNAVVSSNAMHIFKSLRDLDYKHEIKPETLAFCFSSKEVQAINKAWSSLDTYLELYFRETYNGDEMGLLVTHAPIVIEPFENLEKELNEIRSNNLN